jgi:toxin HigB-1
MDVTYEDDRLCKLCTDEREMRKKRSDLAPKIKMRIKALETAATVGELRTHDPLGYWHPLTTNLNGLWSGRLSRNHRILIRPEGDGEAADAVEVTVVEVGEDYH